MITFTVDGQPIPKARARVVVGRDSRSRAYTPTKTVAWEQQIGWAALAAGVRATCANVALSMEFRRKGLVRADLDNMVKSVLDGLNGIAFEDDCQVVALTASVQYNSREPGVTVGIRRVA